MSGREEVRERPKAKAINFFLKPKRAGWRWLWLWYSLHLLVFPFIIEFFIWSGRHTYVVWKDRKGNKVAPEKNIGLSFTTQKIRRRLSEQKSKEITNEEIQYLKDNGNAAIVFFDRDNLSPSEIEAYASIAASQVKSPDKYGIYTKINRIYLYQSASKSFDGAVDVLNSLNLIELLTISQIKTAYKSYERQYIEKGSKNFVEFGQIERLVNFNIHTKTKAKKKNNNPIFYEIYDAICFLRKLPQEKDYQKYAEVAYHWRESLELFGLIKKYLPIAVTHNIEAAKYVLASRRFREILEENGREDFCMVYKEKFEGQINGEQSIMLSNRKHFILDSTVKEWLRPELEKAEEEEDDEEEDKFLQEEFESEDGDDASKNLQ